MPLGVFVRMVDEGLGFVLVEFLIGADQFVDVAAVAGVFVEPVAQRAAVIVLICCLVQRSN